MGSQTNRVFYQIHTKFLNTGKSTLFSRVHIWENEIIWKTIPYRYCKSTISDVNRCCIKDVTILIIEPLKSQLFGQVSLGKFWEKKAALGNTLTSPRKFCIKALLFNFYFLNNNNNKKIVHLGKLSCYPLTFQNTKLKKIPVKKKTGLQPSIQLLIAVVVTQVPWKSLCFGRL